MTIMTKRGNLDNIVTYEHICDTYEDLQNIDPKYATLGSTAIVINQEEGLNAYMATSAGEWVPIGTASSGGGEGGGGGGITPTGTYNITANGTYNVTRYATAKVNVDISEYASVDVNVPMPKAAVLKENKILIPTTTEQNINAENDGFDGYKNVIVTKKDVDITTHQIVQPNESIQYVFGEDLIIIPTGTVKENPNQSLSYISFLLNKTLPNISYYYLRSGATHITLVSGVEYDVQFKSGYICPNSYIDFTSNADGLKVALRNQAINFDLSAKSYVATATVTEPIILEKVCNLNALYDINRSDGSPDLSRGYQLDTTQISLTDNNLYAIYAITSISGNIDNSIIFEPFIWDSINGFVGKYNNSSDEEIQIGLSSDYVLSLISDDLKYAGHVYICELNFDNIKNYIDYVTVNPITLQEKTVTPTEETQIIQPQNTYILATLPVDTQSTYGSTAQFDLNFTPQTYHKYNIHGQLIYDQTTITIDTDNFLYLENQSIPYTSNTSNSAISKIVFSDNYLRIHFTSGWHVVAISSELTIAEEGNCSEIIRTESSRTSEFEANFENAPLVIGKTYSVHANAHSLEQQTVTKEETIMEDFIWNGIKKNITTEYYKVEITSNSIILFPLYNAFNGMAGGLVLLDKNKDYGLSQVTVNPIPPEYIIPANTKCIWADSNYSLPLEDIGQYKNISINGAPIKDGEVRLWVQAEAQETVSFTISFYGYTGSIVTVDWGDNNTNTYNGNNNPNCNIMHTYADKGIYMITIHQEGSNGHSTFSRYACGQDVNNHNTNLLSIELSAFSYYLTYGSSGGSGYTASEQAFKYCDNLKRVTLHHCSPAYDAGLFSDCPNLETVDIDDRLGGSTFNNCPNLKNVYINGNISIDNTFSSCTSIENITVTATTPQSIVANAFPLNNNLKIYVPADSVEAYKTAENWSAYANYITAIQE